MFLPVLFAAFSLFLTRVNYHLVANFLITDDVLRYCFVVLLMTCYVIALLQRQLAQQQQRNLMASNFRPTAQQIRDAMPALQFGFNSTGMFALLPYEEFYYLLGFR